MAAPSLMFEHGINVPKGWWDEAALDFSAKLSSDVDFDVPGGRVVHVNAAGEFEMGVGETDIAIFLIQGSDAFDVANPGTTPAGNFMHKAILPAGDMSGVVATGAYEIESTEYDTAQSYVPGDLLTAAADNADADVGGVITNQGSGANGEVQQYVDPVIGVVSRGSYNNEHGIPILAFWPVWLPGEYQS